MPFTLYLPRGPASKLVGGCSTKEPEVAGVGSAVGARGAASGAAGAATGVDGRADEEDWSEAVFCSVA